MSMQDRLRRIEQDIRELKQAFAELAGVQSVMADTLEPDDEPTRDLDGNVYVEQGEARSLDD